MEILEIRKEKVMMINVIKPEASISEEARDVLGYDAMAVAERMASVDHKLPPLKAALAQLDIEVLNHHDVVRYKMEARHEVERAELARILASGENGEAVMFWSEHPIVGYQKPIPEFVLNKAVQIKNAIPSVELFVVTLESYPDPFLLAKIAYREEYYIEVWDEPKFEGRR